MALSLATIFMRIIIFIKNFIPFSLVVMNRLWPSLMFRIMIWYKCQESNVKVKHVKSDDDYVFSYLCRGEPGPQPSILMLHGFLLNKETWLNTIKLFPKDLHVVCVDMPGHGGTTHLLSESYAAEDQAKRINEFVKCSGLIQKPFHLVGISVGGMVAGLYAALYPSDVCCLSLLCPTGLNHPSVSELIGRVKTIEIPRNLKTISFFPWTTKYENAIFKLGLHNPSKTNIQVLKGYFDHQARNKIYFMKCLLDITSMKERHSLQDNISKITVPTQIIWGKSDQILHSSAADILAEGIPNSEVHLLEKCGHFIMFDRPRKCAKLILQFYKSVCDQNQNKKLI